MKNKTFLVSPVEKKNIINNMKRYFENRPEVAFVFLHGSFATDDRIKDIDLAVYLNPPPSSPLQSELEMETELGNQIKAFPVDVRILNGAPLSFRFNVINMASLS